MTRPDLLALTPETVAALTNMGLVRRALKEIEGGHGPLLEEAAGGAVTGRFHDGVVTTLRPGEPIPAGDCTCAAAGACRHRVAVALAYRAWHEGRSVAPRALPSRHWSPGDLPDERLEAALGKRVVRRAKMLRQRGGAVDLRRADDDGPAEARLATCTVRFLVPHDLAYATCDCASDRACEHIAIAAWAFREADAHGLGGSQVTVDSAPGVASETAREALNAGLAFTREVLLQGAVHVPAAITARLSRARAGLTEAGLTWPGTILDDLEEQLSAYRDRSARYSAPSLARLLAELPARRMAADRSTALPPRYVLGHGEAPEMLLGHMRLVALGARVFGGQLERWADIFLADASSGIVLVFTKHWDYRKAGLTPEDGPALAQRAVVQGVTLEALASGAVTTRAAKRRANNALRLRSARRDAMLVTPQANDWEQLPDAIRIRDLSRYAVALRARPPRWLRPRVLAESMHIVEIAQVIDLVYSPGSQTLVASVADPAGHPLRLMLRHRSVAPNALEATAAALTRLPAARYVSGPLYAGEAGLEMIPIAFIADRVIVPDLEPASAIDVPAGEIDLDEAPLAAAATEAWNALVDGAHTGLLYPSTWLDRLSRAGQRCARLGLLETAASLDRVTVAARRLQGGGSPPTDTDARAATEAWERAAIRLSVTREHL